MREKMLRAIAAVTLMGLSGLAWAGGQQVVAGVATDGKSVVVRTYRCGTPADLSVTGRAEGLVKGERRSIPLQISRGSEPGVFTVTRQWPTEGEWVLNLAVEGGHSANAIVKMAPGTELKIASQQFSYEKPTPREIEIALKTEK